MGKAKCKNNKNESATSRMDSRIPRLARECKGEVLCLEYMHTFAIIKFQKNSNYEVILGRSLSCDSLE